MPKAIKIGVMAIWDRFEIDHAFEELRVESENSFDVLFRKASAKV